MVDVDGGGGRREVGIYHASGVVVVHVTDIRVAYGGQGLDGLASLGVVLLEDGSMMVVGVGFGRPPTGTSDGVVLGRAAGSSRSRCEYVQVHHDGS